MDTANLSEINLDTLLAREASHRIKNDLQLLANWVSTKKEQSDANTTMQRELAHKIQVIARLHNRLSARLNTHVELATELDALAKDLAALSESGNPVKITVSVDSEPIPAQEARFILILAHELTVNALKHAFAGSGGAITITFSSREGRRTLEVGDDGRGYGASVSAGDGTWICAALAEGLGGALTRRSSLPQGSVIELSWRPENEAPSVDPPQSTVGLNPARRTTEREDTRAPNTVERRRAA